MCLICAGSIAGVSCLKIVLEFRLLVLFYYAETLYFNMGDAVPVGDDDDPDLEVPDGEEDNPDDRLPEHVAHIGP